MASEHTLYLVATPIGHLDDIGLRAISVLRKVDVIYAEDTRHSARLLKAHGIETPLQALHEHNEADRAEAIAARVRDSGDAALISDAGTPLISDPGYRLVGACINAGVKVSPVPGPCALVAALSASGLPTDRFTYAGFPPSRGAARSGWFEQMSRLGHTLVLYESPHRIVDTLERLVQCCGSERPAVVARELTKRFETLLRGSLGELLTRITNDPDQRRGEFVLVVGAASDSDGSSDEVAGVSITELVGAIAPHLPPGKAASIIADLAKVPKREAYAKVLALRPDSGST
jgi:16S rRNA (cytidine1402-2'-O)-methyltransferase